MWLTSKYYPVQNEALNENKCSCKGVSQKHNDLYFQCYKNALDVFLKTRKDIELEGKDIGKAIIWVLEPMSKALCHARKTSSNYLFITISAMSWLITFIQGR